MRGGEVRREVSSADYARLAVDCERWGLSPEAEMLREKSRQAAVREIKANAIAGALTRARSA